MILMNKVVIDIQGFDESQFGIFNEIERDDLLRIWESDRNPNRFISLLSPDQKMRVAQWAANRTAYPISDLIAALEKFVKHLKTVSYKTYPKPMATAAAKKKNLTKMFTRM